MRKAIKPDFYEYNDGDTNFYTTDKKLAVIVFKYAKGLINGTFDYLKEEAMDDLTSQIAKLKKEIKEENGK